MQCTTICKAPIAHLSRLAYEFSRVGAATPLGMQVFQISALVYIITDQDVKSRDKTRVKKTRQGLAHTPCALTRDMRGQPQAGALPRVFSGRNFGRNFGRNTAFSETQSLLRSATIADNPRKQCKIHVNHHEIAPETHRLSPSRPLFRVARFRAFSDSL